MEDIKVKNYSLFSNTMYWMKYYWCQNKIIILMSIVQIVLSSIIPLVGIYLPKITLDMVEEGVTAQKLILTLGIFVILATMLYSLNNAVSRGKYFLYNVERGYIMAELFLKSLRVRYDITESGKGKTAYQKAIGAAGGGDWSSSSRTLTATVSICINVICFLLYSTVLGSLSIWIIIPLIGMSLLNCIWISLNLKYRESVREEEANIDRRFQYVRASMGDTTAAKDIRIFGMNNWLIGLRDKAIAESEHLCGKINRRNSWQEKMNFLTATIRDIIAYGYLIYASTMGRISVGEFILYFGAITGFSEFVTSIVWDIGSLKAAKNSTDYYRTYMELPDEDLFSGEKHISELKLPISIEFKNVSFSYKSYTGEQDDTDKKVFDCFNLKIEAGEKVALVGINGAGKTTLVKLLCGMYEPDEGEILINGIKRSYFPKGELYDLFSVVFQEQLILPFSVGENIAMNRAKSVDEKRAWEALEKAGIKKLFIEKDIDLNTFMSKRILKRGVSLSGGQQQRLLLARALYKDGDIMVLDEPTAALDPIAESEIYESYNKYTENKTALFISHRLASTRFSDRIVMLENGEVIEMGTHNELMQNGGTYAQMYQVQSNYYSESEVQA